MDPNDLLYLHSTLAATIRSQEQTIFRLSREVEELRDAAESAADSVTGSAVTP